MKLEQLGWILRLVVLLEKRDEKIWQGRAQAKTIRPIGRKWIGDHARRTEIQVLTEAFYYAACRFREIARNKLRWKGFESQRIRIVRNDLLEHPHDLYSNPNFAYGDPCGPRIKLFGPAGRTFTDPGLYVNAHEFVDRVVSRLNKLADRKGGA